MTAPGHVRDREVGEVDLVGGKPGAVRRRSGGEPAAEERELEAEASSIGRGDVAGVVPPLGLVVEVRPVVGGKQIYRTASLMAFPRNLLYGTDDPRGQNHILSLDRNSGEVKKIQAVPGPVLRGCRVGEWAAFATMAEKANHEVTVWAGDESGFHRIAHFPGRKMNQAWREIVGYDTVLLPEGRSAWPFLYCTPVGISKSAGHLLRVDLREEQPPKADAKNARLARLRSGPAGLEEHEQSSLKERHAGGGA